MSTRPFAAVVIAGLLAASANAAEPSSPFAGRWITESGNLEIEIAPCGDAWCGTVTREFGNRSMSLPGQQMAPVDSRPALGMRILTAMVPSSDATSLSGDIYNRENGKTYSVRLTLDTAHQLNVRAYAVLPLFGKTQRWQRSAGTSVAPADTAASQPKRPSSAP
jgi:uncharacterized protein (DUF2147 family)